MGGRLDLDVFHVVAKQPIVAFFDFFFLPLRAHISLCAFGVGQGGVVKTLGIGVGAIDHHFSSFEPEFFITLQGLRYRVGVFFNAARQNIAIFE